MATSEYTYEKRLGWVWDKKPLERKCTKCGDPFCHTKEGWFTRGCVPVIVPDQWESDSIAPTKPLPDDIEGVKLEEDGG